MARTLWQDGVLARHGVTLLGCSAGPAQIPTAAADGDPRWRSYEFVVLRDLADVAVVCAIEYHGDVAIAPARPVDRSAVEAAIAVAHQSGIEGVCTMRIDIDGATASTVDWTPWLSDATTLAERATGIPIVDIAVRIALGHTLAESHVRGDAVRSVTVRFPTATATGTTIAEALNGDPLWTESAGVAPESTALPDTLFARLAAAPLLDAPLLHEAKRAGLSDARIAGLRPEMAGEDGVRSRRHRLGLRPTFRSVSGSRYRYPTYQAGPARQWSFDRRPGVVVLSPASDDDGTVSTAAAALTAAGFDVVLCGAGVAERVVTMPVTVENVLELVHALGDCPVLVPTGGPASSELRRRLAEAGVRVAGGAAEPDGAQPVGTDVPGAIDLAVDVLSDGTESFVAGVVEFLDHDDGVGVLPPLSVGPDVLDRLRRDVGVLARARSAPGPFSVRYTLTDGVLSARFATTGTSAMTAFLSRATGVPLVAAGARVALGETLAALRAEGVLPRRDEPGERVAVLAHHRIGIGESFGQAFARAAAAAGILLPRCGRVSLSIAEDRLPEILDLLAAVPSAFEFHVRPPLADVLRRNGITVASEGSGCVLAVHLSGESPPGDMPVVATLGQLRGLVHALRAAEPGTPDPLPDRGPVAALRAHGRALPVLTMPGGPQVLRPTIPVRQGERR